MAASFWGSSIGDPLADRQQPGQHPPRHVPNSRCPDFISFLGIVFEASLSPEEEKLLKVLTNSSPDFEDVSLGGASFGVRKVRPTAFPLGIAPGIFKDRKFVVVKQPKIFDNIFHDVFSEIATELQVLRHPPLRKHQNIINLLAVMHHNGGVDNEEILMPALVLEYADFGNVASYQADGLARSVHDRIDICHDAALGLQALHEAGIIHGDVKSENLLVCRHASRKFIVKLSDFGFSISMVDSNPHLVGHTKYFEAPEASAPLDPRYLVQLDVYSFGLLLYTVFKHGARFFEAGPPEGRDDNTKKMKLTNLIAVLCQTNLMLKHKEDRAPLFIICNILNYSLQSLPSRRFRTMARIASLLSLARPSELDVQAHREDPLYQIQRWSVVDFRQSRDQLSKLLKDGIESYFSSLDGGALLPVLKDLFLARAEIEIDMFHGVMPEDATHIEFVPAHSLGIVRDTLGLSPEQDLAGKPLPGARGQEILTGLLEKRLHFSSNFMPDISMKSGLLRQAPIIIQNAIRMGLEKIAMSTVDLSRVAMAKFNLSCIYADAIGVRANLSKARQYMLEAAQSGLTRAQTAYVHAFCKGWNHIGLNEDAYKDYIANAAANGDLRALRLLRVIDPSKYSKAQQTQRLQNTFYGRRRTFDSMNNFGSNNRSESLDTLDWTSWRRLFLHFAAATNNFNLASDLISSDPSFIDQRDSSGQTALIIACQFGCYSVVKTLIQNGSDLAKADNFGITALHWIICLDSEEQQEFANEIRSRPYEVDAWATVGPSQDDKFRNLHNSIGPPCDGTPLNWAVRCGDLAAVNILLDLGSNPLHRGPKNTETAFESACSLYMSRILQRLLRVPSVLALTSDVLVLNGNTMIRPLLWSLMPGSRWLRMLRFGPDHLINVKETIDTLMPNGNDYEWVLKSGPLEMPPVFAVIFNGCMPEVLEAVLATTTKTQLERGFGSASSGGTPLFAAITDRYYEMFLMLLKAGANVMARDSFNWTPIYRAAKENDDVFFAEKLLEYGAKCTTQDDATLSPFFIAVYNGNLKVARYLFDHGCDRDEFEQSSGTSILGTLLQLRAKNSATRIAFLLSLPDHESDGFTVVEDRKCNISFSALHFAVVATPLISEDPELTEVSRLIFSLLMRKFSHQKYLDNTVNGPHRMTALACAVEVGNYKIVKILLEAGADPNIHDEYGRTALDLAYWRYCYPESTGTLKQMGGNEKLQMMRSLEFINHNTSEILSLLKSYDAKENVFKFPTWHQSNPGYRNIEWVSARIKESKDAVLAKTEVDEEETPNWGGHTINLPKRPMPPLE